jgi:hypothetical protein
MSVEFQVRALDIPIPGDRLDSAMVRLAEKGWIDAERTVVGEWIVWQPGNREAVGSDGQGVVKPNEKGIYVASFTLNLDLTAKLIEGLQQTLEDYGHRTEVEEL